MTLLHSINEFVRRHASVAAGVYVVVVVLSWMIVVDSLLDIAGHVEAVTESGQTLAQLQAHAQKTPSELTWNNASAPTGSPFVEGQTVTVAGAALMHRVTAAISRVGGNVVSSEIAPHVGKSNAGSVRVVVTCEVEQIALQRLVYDLEAGMPFLFIEQLDAEVPSGTNKLMRIVLDVSGLWQGAK
jgi:general secretion pathway protein M